MSGTFTWKQDTRQYRDGQLLFLGPWCVGSVFFNSLKPRGQDSEWRATCGLPGVKPVVGDFQSTEEAKRQLEQLVSMWLARATEKK